MFLSINNVNKQFKNRDNKEETVLTNIDLQVKEGESFTTTCNWNNDTDEVLHFPHEMCVATALVYPATISMVCDVD